MEAIRGEEFVTFNQEDADRQPFLSTILPFTRNLFDPMDYTPVNFSGIPTWVERRTTKGFEAALFKGRYQGCNNKRFQHNKIFDKI